MTSNPLFILAVLCGNVILCEWLVKNTRLRPLSTALLVIVLTAIVANLGLIPAASNAPPLYNGIFSYLAPLSIFYLLLEVSLKNLRLAGLPMLLMFLIGSMATVLGVIVGMWVIDGSAVIGEYYPAIAGMFTGTYTGGSANFNAVALHYEIMKEGTLFAGTVAVDNIITAFWMVVCIAAPKVLQSFFPRKKIISKIPSNSKSLPKESDVESLDPNGLAIMVALGVFVLWLSNSLASWLEASFSLSIPSILLLTTFALILAQIPLIQKLQGGRLLGLFCVYIFLAVIGAYCEIAALGNIGALAVSLLIFAFILALIHGMVTFGVGAILKYDWDLISIASQANIGGSSTALALSKSLERSDLLLPAILVGSLGNGLGTYLGFLVAGFLQ